MPELKKEINQLRSESQAYGFWNDAQRAAQVTQRLAHLQEEVDFWEGLKQEIQDLEDLLEVSKHDTDIKKEIQERLRKLEKSYEREEFKIFLSGEHDKADAFLSIYSGAGGLDAQDWAKMLLRMYRKYLENKNYEINLQHISYGEEDGVKEATIEIKGNYAYGIMKYETGVHRLVRISPFSAKKQRHTSFALVEVIPKFEEVSAEDIEIPESDLRIDTFRASGPGGQYVNTTESAVRITHLPTKVSASSQTERLQGLNKERAMKLLRSKLYMLKQRERKEKLEEMKDSDANPEWGNQIRNYVLHPYQLVKDTRTGVETSNVEEVLDGKLDKFIDEEIKKLK